MVKPERTLDRSSCDLMATTANPCLLPPSMVVLAGPPELMTVMALPKKSIFFVVGAGGDEDGVVVVGGVDARLDGGLVGGHVNSLLRKRGGDEAECEYQPESRIKTA